MRRTETNTKFYNPLKIRQCTRFPCQPLLCRQMSLHPGCLHAKGKTSFGTNGHVYATSNIGSTFTREEKHSKYYREGKTRSPGPQGQHPLPVRFRFCLTHQSCPISVLICNQLSLTSQNTPNTKPHSVKSK
jgi:hypothetical protein